MRADPDRRTRYGGDRVDRANGRDRQVGCQMEIQAGSIGLISERRLLNLRRPGKPETVDSPGGSMYIAKIR